MVDLITILKVVAIGGVLFTAGCDQPAAVAADPEAAHCERVAQRLVRDMGKVAILESKAWTSEGMRNVRVRFQYPANRDDLNVGNVLCTYDFPLDVRGDKGRFPQAKSVYFQARNLSQNELLLVNMAVRGTQPDYKIK